MKNLLTSILFFVALTTWAQTNTNTRQIRFFPVVTAGDTTAQASYDGRMWYDFVTDEFRGIRNGTAFSFGAGGGTYTAGSGLTLTGSAFSWGGTLTGATTIAQDGFNTTFTGTGTVTFSPTATRSGVNVGQLSGDPGALINGDIWYDNNIVSNDNRLRARIGNVTQFILTGTGTQTLTNKTLSTGTIFSNSPTINSGSKFTFSPSATVSGFNAGTLAGNPSAPVNGDIWNNTSTGTLNTYVSGQLNRLLGAIGAGLTPGRIPFTAGGSTAILQDDSDLTFSTDRLTATNFTATTDLRGQYLTSGRVPFVTTSGSIADDPDLAWDNSTNVFSINTGIIRNTNTGYITFQSTGTSDSQDYTVDWLTGSVVNGGTTSFAINIFLSTAGVELEDKSALVEYNVLLTKSDGSDNQVKKILVGYRKDGVADPVQTGSETELFSVGNATPTVTFSIVSGNPQININDNTSGGWKVKVWAKVSLSN